MGAIRLNLHGFHQARRRTAVRRPPSSCFRTLIAPCMGASIIEVVWLRLPFKPRLLSAVADATAPAAGAACDHPGSTTVAGPALPALPYRAGSPIENTMIGIRFSRASAKAVASITLRSAGNGLRMLSGRSARAFVLLGIALYRRRHSLPSARRRNQARTRAVRRRVGCEEMDFPVPPASSTILPLSMSAAPKTADKSRRPAAISERHRSCRHASTSSAASNASALMSVAKFPCCRDRAWRASCRDVHTATILPPPPPRERDAEIASRRKVGDDPLKNMPIDADGTQALRASPESFTITRA